MSQVLHPLVTHCSGHTFKRMCRTEDLINGIFVLRLILEDHQLVGKSLQMFVCFIEENSEILAYIHN